MVIIMFALSLVLVAILIGVIALLAPSRSADLEDSELPSAHAVGVHHPPDLVVL